MLKALLAGAAVTLAIAAGPALAQSTIKPPGGPMPMGPAAQASPPLQAPMQQTPILQPPIAQSPSPSQQVVPDEPVTPADRAAVRRDWNEMAREWQQRERSGTALPQGSVGAPTMGGGPYGGYGSDTRIAPSQPYGGQPSARTRMPMRSTGLQGDTSDVPRTPAERAQGHRDYNDASREWDERQRSGITPPAGMVQPPLPYQR